MKEPKVQVGILFEPQIEFILNGQYVINGIHVTGRQVAPMTKIRFFGKGGCTTNSSLNPHRNKRARST
jgi:hypothetical protein